MWGLCFTLSCFFEWVGMTSWENTQRISNMYVLRLLRESVLVSSTDTAIESRGSGKASVL